MARAGPSWLASRLNGDTMFNMFPESVFREHLALDVSPTALVIVQGELVTSKTVESQVARICTVQLAWRWEAIPNGVNSFTV